MQIASPSRLKAEIAASYDSVPSFAENLNDIK